MRAPSALILLQIGAILPPYCAYVLLLSHSPHPIHHELAPAQWRVVRSLGTVNLRSINRDFTRLYTH